MFRASFCPSSGVLLCTFGTGKFHAGFFDGTILTVLGNGHQKSLQETYQCRMYCGELMMDREDARNM
jgi:hypothetical protein